MGILDNITKLLDERKIKQIELTNYLGVTKNTFSNWKSGRTQSYMKYLPQIAEFLGVSVDSLSGNKICTSNIQKFFDVGYDEQTGVLPVYGTISAGLGIVAEETLLDFEAADKRYIDGNHFYLKVKGDSMIPIINDGDLLLVNKQSTLDNGDLGAFIIDGEEGIVKKYEYTGKQINLISFNIYYPTKEFVGADMERVQIVGKVVELKRKF